MPENSPDTEPGQSNSKSLGRATAHGISWMTVSLVVGKVSIFLALVVLGWMLTQEDFGVFAIAATVIAFIKIFHDGGVPQVLVQRGEAEYDRLQGAMFWLSLGVSTAAGILLAIAAPWIAELYGDRRLASMLWVLAVTLPLGAPANMLRSKLQLDLKFRSLAMLSSVQFAVRSLGMIVLALLGFGVMSFVLPLIAVAIVSDVMTYMATRAKPWRHPVLFREWPGLLSDSNWIVLATLFKGLARNGDYLVLGLMLSKALLGVYYFAYQLTIQITLLIALNLRHVLFPVMTKLADQPARQAGAIAKSIRMLMLVAAPSSILIALTIRPLEELVWHQKWADSVPLIQIFAVVSPILILTDVIHAALTSRGRFRFSAVLTLVEGLWLMASAWAAVKLVGTENITAIAIWIFSLQVVYALVVNGWLLNMLQVGVATYLRVLLPQWIVALAAAGLASIVAQILPEHAPPLLQIVVLTVSYLAAFAFGAWVALRSDLEELASVSPRPIAALVRRMFLLRSAENRQVAGNDSTQLRSCS